MGTSRRCGSISRIWEGCGLAFSIFYNEYLAVPLTSQFCQNSLSFGGRKAGGGEEVKRTRGAGKKRTKYGFPCVQKGPKRSPPLRLLTRKGGGFGPRAPPPYIPNDLRDDLAA